jgi:hypothetical protein
VGVKSWPLEPEVLTTFEDAVASVQEVVGEPVILSIRAPGSRDTVSVIGKLEQPENQPGEGVMFRVESAGYFTLYGDDFVSASRHSIDGGAFWGLSIGQAGVELLLSEDKNASPGS